MATSDGSVPSILSLLTFHFECLQGMYFSEQHSLDQGHLLFSDRVTDPYYNFFAPTAVLAGDTLPAGVGEDFRRRNRQAAVYLSPVAGSDEHAFAGEPWARDAWLVGASESLAAEPDSGQVKTSTVGVSQRSAYVEAFTAAYSGDDPDDPYGALEPSYVESLADSFDNDVPGYRKHYVMATVGATPVGVAVMFTSGSLAGVYGVGTVPSHRRAGVGTAMMAHLARIAVEDGASHVMLQTEAGSSVQRWYEKLGYQHAFDAAYFLVGQGKPT